MAIGFKGTSISDIEQGAEDALEEDIANMSPASNSVAGQLDGGVGEISVDDTTTAQLITIFSKSKTVSSGSESGTLEIINITGSGYIPLPVMECFHEVNDVSSDATTAESVFEIVVDGTAIELDTITGTQSSTFSFSSPIYFDNSIKVQSDYVLDEGGSGYDVTVDVRFDPKEYSVNGLVVFLE